MKKLSGRKPQPVELRIMAMMEIADDGCWNFTGALNNVGYGLIHGAPEYRGHRPGMRTAHRAMAEAHGMKIEGVCVLHTCDNPRCVNPEHLWLGTQADNIKDMQRKGRDEFRGTPKGYKFRRVTCPGCNNEVSVNQYNRRDCTHGDNCPRPRKV